MHTRTNLCMHEGKQRLHEGVLSLELEAIDLRVVLEAGLKVLTSGSIEISIGLKASLYGETVMETYMKVLVVSPSTANLGEDTCIPLPAQAYIYPNSAKGRATSVAITLRARVGRLESSFVPWTYM